MFVEALRVARGLAHRVVCHPRLVSIIGGSIPWLRGRAGRRRRGDCLKTGRRDGVDGHEEYGDAVSNSLAPRGRGRWG